MITSPQTDRFVHERLPPKHDWPEITPVPGIAAGQVFNCTHTLLDRHLESGHGDAPALIGEAGVWSYRDLDAYAARIAHLLSGEFGIVPGNRVLLRGANTEMLAAIWLGVQKLGAIAVATMGQLRAGELRVIIEKSRPAVALSEAAIAGDLRDAIAEGATGCRLVTFGEGELEALMARAPDACPACPTLADDISLVAFTSGTTGAPKATVHTHGDVIAICESVCRHIIAPSPSDVFIGTPPLAFTFGLGGLLLFPLHAGASSVLQPRYTPEELLAAIARHRASICFTVPSFYRRMTPFAGADATSSLRLAVSSGEALPVTVRHDWKRATGLDMTELLGSTEMLHAFIGATGADIRDGFIGRAVPGYQLAILGADGAALSAGEIGALAVRGPTGCRYLDDPRQSDYVRDGWNITGDLCSIDADGYVAYHGRRDDMIISAGYNISGLEVENALMSCPDVAECAVIGAPDEERGQIVMAFVVPACASVERDDMIGRIQAHVRANIAPYKYPRRVELVDALPRTATGKLQRFRLQP